MNTYFIYGKTKCTGKLIKFVVQAEISLKVHANRWNS